MHGGHMHGRHTRAGQHVEGARCDARLGGLHLADGRAPMALAWASAPKWWRQDDAYVLVQGPRRAGPLSLLLVRLWWPAALVTLAVLEPQIPANLNGAPPAVGFFWGSCNPSQRAAWLLVSSGALECGVPICRSGDRGVPVRVPVRVRAAGWMSPLPSCVLVSFPACRTVWERGKGGPFGGPWRSTSTRMHALGL